MQPMLAMIDVSSAMLVLDACHAQSICLGCWHPAFHCKGLRCLPVPRLATAKMFASAYALPISMTVSVSQSQLKLLYSSTMKALKDLSPVKCLTMDGYAIIGNTFPVAHMQPMLSMIDLKTGISSC